MGPYLFRAERTGRWSGVGRASGRGEAGLEVGDGVGEEASEPGEGRRREVASRFGHPRFEGCLAAGDDAPRQGRHVEVVAEARVALPDGGADLVGAVVEGLQ